MRVLLGNDPRSYRDTLATVLRHLHPDVEVSTAEPGDLDREVSLLRPEFVVCSHLSETVEREAPAWVELYPGGASYSRVCVGGGTSTHPDMNLDTLLSVLDLALR